MSVYGIIWNGDRDNRCTRTDAAANMADPLPYAAFITDPSECSSPFDTCMPWSGMVKSEGTDGVWVSIPKYWYKWTKLDDKAIQLQISDEELDGYSVSPAHMDRGDGAGERDVVYIGRYVSNKVDYAPRSRSTPVANATRQEMRSYVRQVGTNTYLQDFAMFWTIRMLYLVEYANWDSQDTIGSGINDALNLNTTGMTDSMPYHTGTTSSDRWSGGYCQYRWIEGIPGGNAEYIDGIRFAKKNIYVFLDPTASSDVYGGELIGERPEESGCIMSWEIPEKEGYEWCLFPKEVSTKSIFTFKGLCGSYEELIAKTDAQENDIYRVQSSYTDAAGQTYDMLTDYVCTIPETPGEASWRLREYYEVLYIYGDYCCDHYGCIKDKETEEIKGSVLYTGAKYNSAHTNGMFFLNTAHEKDDVSARRTGRAMKLKNND